MHQYMAVQEINDLFCCTAAELTPSQARINLPPSHPLLNNTRPAATTPPLNTSPHTPHPTPAPASSQHACITSPTDAMDSARIAPTHGAAAVAGCSTAAAATTTAAATVASNSAVGVASQSSKGSSHISIPAAASRVVTRLRKASTDYMFGASLPASDSCDAGPTQPSQLESAELTHLGEMSEQANLGNSARLTADNKDISMSDMTSSGHDAAANAFEQSSDVMMADGSKADDASAGHAETAGLTVGSATDMPPEAEGRQVSSWLGCHVNCM